MRSQKGAVGGEREPGKRLFEREIGRENGGREKQGEHMVSTSVSQPHHYCHFGPNILCRGALSCAM